MFCSDVTHLLLGEAFWAQTPELRFSEAALELIGRLSKELKQPFYATRKGLTKLMVAELRAQSPVMVAERITGVDFTVGGEDDAPAAVFAIDFACLAISDATGEATLRFDVDVLRHGMA